MSHSYPFHLFKGHPNSNGFSGINRNADIREDKNWKRRLFDDPSTKFLLYWRSKALISEPKLGSPFATELNLREISQLADISDNAIFLGQKNGEHYVGLDVSSVDEGEVNEILP